MAIKTITQYLDCQEIKGIFPDDYQASTEVPYSNGNLSMRFLVTKMIDENTDLAGYLFTPQILQSKNTASIGTDVEITIKSNSSAEFKTQPLYSKILPALPNINKVLSVGEWIDICPALCWGWQMPQRGKLYNFSGSLNIEYLITGEAGNRSVTFEFSNSLTTETLEQSIFNPLYVYPYNNSVDASEAEIDFNFQFNGDELKTYYNEIFETNSQQRVYPPPLMGNSLINLETPVYNGYEQRFKIPNGYYNTHNLINNNNYNWHLIMSRYSNSDNSNNLVDDSKFLFYSKPSTLTQYIQLEKISRDSAYYAQGCPSINYTPTPFTKIRIKFRGNARGGNIIGKVNTEARSYRFFNYMPDNGFYLDCGSGDGYNRVSASNTWQNNTVYDLTFGNRYVYDNINQNYIINSSPVDFSLVGLISKLNIGEYFDGDFYNIQIYEGDVIKRDYIPVETLNNSPHHVGLLDKIENSFVDFTDYNYTPGNVVGEFYEEVGISNFSQLSTPLSLGLDYSNLEYIIGEDNNNLEGFDLRFDSSYFESPQSFFLDYNMKFYIYPAQSTIENTIDLFSFPFTYKNNGNEHTTNFGIRGFIEDNNLRFEVFGTSESTISLPIDIPISNMVSPTNENFSENEDFINLQVKIGYQPAHGEVGDRIQILITIKYKSYTIQDYGIYIEVDEPPTFVKQGDTTVLNIFNINLKNSSQISEWYRNLYSINIGSPLTNSIVPMIDNITSNFVLFDIQQNRLFNPQQLIKSQYYSTQITYSLNKITKFSQYPKFETPDYGFFTYNMPELSYTINNVDVVDIDDTQIITSPELNLKVEYSQAQNIAVKYYNFIFTDNLGNIIQQTENIYSNEIKFNYSGLINGNNYNLTLFIVTQAGQEILQTIKLISNYTLLAFDLEKVTVVGLNSMGAVCITDISDYSFFQVLQEYNKITLYRQEANNNYYEKIQEISLLNEQVVPLGSLLFVDYGTKNNQTYTYKIIATTTEGSNVRYYNIGNYSNGKEVPLKITTNWYNFNLYKLNYNLVRNNIVSYDILNNISKYNFTASMGQKLELYHDTFNYNYTISYTDTIPLIDTLWDNMDCGDYLIIGIAKKDPFVTRYCHIIKILSKEISQFVDETNHTVTYNIVTTALLSEDQDLTVIAEEIGDSILLYSSSLHFNFTLLKQQQDNSHWSFGLNCQENSITLNQNKAPVATFARFPKYTIGDNNYHSGSFSALLGEYNNLFYQDNINKVNLWNAFIQNNKVYLYKNRKGDVMIIAIDSNSTREYMNEVANYYDNNGEINTYPTTINFNYTEVDNINKLQGVINLSTIIGLTSE